MHYQRLIYILLVWTAIQKVSAQVITTPLSVNPPQYEQYWKSERDKAAIGFLQKETQTHTVPIPFFDDFSGSDPTWSLTRFYFALPINRVWFWENGNGRAFGNRGISLNTPNRGREWNALSSPTTSHIQDVYFVGTSGTGFGCGSQGWLASTVDSGASWTSLVSPTDTTLTDVFFVDAQTGMLADTAGRLYATTNAGQSWTLASSVPVKVRSVYMTDALTAYVAGYNASIAKTTDGGLTWNLLTGSSLARQPFNKLTFVTSSIGLAVGDSGLIFRTQDGGNFWYRVNSASTGDILDVGFAAQINQNIGWAIGRGGLLLSTTNGGLSWTTLRTGTNDDLNTIRMITEYQGWIGTSNGRLLHMLLDPMRADSKWWERNGGTYINNTFCVDPISIGVATFDGLNERGLPYSLIANAIGSCDTLTSVQVDVEGVANPVYVSFYYQAGSWKKEMVPDAIDSLILQFKKPDSTWISVWRATGNQDLIITPFRYVSIPIASDLKHKDFQFRFINFGSRNGAYDVWSVDYVRVNTENSPTDSSALDVSVIQKPGRLLKNFHAYPVDQFNGIVGRSDFFADTLRSKVRNLNPETSGLTPQNGAFQVTDLYRSLPLVMVSENINGLINPIPNQNAITPIYLDKQSYQAQINTIPFATTLGYGFVLDKGQYNTVPNNDTVFSTLNLSTYMAYDDGSAELSRYVDGAASRAAVRFDLERTDTLTDIHLYFPRVPTTQTQTISFLLMAYSDINVENNTDKELFRISCVLPPQDSVNRFDRFSLRTIPLEKRILQGGKPFYIGWQQRLVDNGNEFRIGVDVNSENPGVFYFNSTAKWQIWDQDSYPPMIRPVFGIESPTAVKPILSTARSPFFPNPASQSIRNRESFSNLQILNSLGQEVQQLDNGMAGQPIRLHLQTGLYFLKWQQTDGQWVSQRLLVE